MPLDAQKLRDFYGSPLGDLARRLIGRIVRARWLGAAGLTVAALGYGSPYLDRFRDTATRCLALMPAEQGAAVWPEPDRCAVALVEAGMLPLPDNSVDRLLIAHALEAAERPAELLEEAWRVVAPEGRILAIVPSRRGVWARADGTPFGHGLPYSKTQLRDILQDAVFSPVFWGEALFAPPIDRKFVIRSAPDNRARGRGPCSAFRRRPCGRGDQAGPPAGRRPCDPGRPAGCGRSRARAERAEAGSRMLRSCVDLILGARGDDGLNPFWSSNAVKTDAE